MNEQKATSPNAIGWTRVRLPDGTRLRGFTSNPVVGCKHACRWTMPDGSIAKCYAETFTERWHPGNFTNVRFVPSELANIEKRKAASGIFIDSMSDLMGAGVKDEWIRAVIATMRNCPQHIFQVLTKSAPRLLKFDWPENVWLGASSPPSFMNGRELSDGQ